MSIITVQYEEFEEIAKDPRQAYRAMQEQLTDIIRAFRDLPNMNVYFSAKCEKSADEAGRVIKLVSNYRIFSIK